MQAADYDAWYRTPRGAWIGGVEYRLLSRLLEALPGETLLDVGSGTGYFTRRFAADGLAVTGLDPNSEWLAFAEANTRSGEEFVAGRAERLPFADRSFDLSVSVAALCFVREQQQALREMLRVTRRRFAVGLLSRHSLLYLQKGRGGGKGAYRGAHWHSAAEIRALFDGLPVENLAIRSAVFLPGGGMFARSAERILPACLPWGAFLVAAGDVVSLGLKEALKKCASGMKCKEPGAQRPRHINEIGEGASTAQRSDSPAQPLFQSFLNGRL